MTLAIARHEFTQLARDGRFRWATALVLLLLLAAVASGWRYQRQQAQEKARARQTEQARWLGQGPKNPHSAAHYGIYAFKPVSPLTAIDQGIEPYVGTGIWLEAHNMNEFVHRPAQDATALARFGELTAALTLQVMLPLLIVLLAFGVFAAERESGLLRQMLSAGASPRALVGGKLLGVGAALSVALVPATLLGVAAVALHGTAELPMTAGRLALLAFVYLAYLGVFALVTFVVSAYARTARQSLVISLGLWIVCCLIVPRVASGVAERLHPVPSLAAFEKRKAEIFAPAHADRGLTVRDRVMKQYGVTRPEDLPIDWRGISLQEGEEANHTGFDQVHNELFDVYRAQDRVLQIASVASPLLAAQSLSLALSGTDFEHHRRFVFAAEEQRRVMQKILNGDVTLHDREGTDYRAGPEMWAKIPPFTYQPPTLRDVLPYYGWAVALLGAWLAVSAWAAVHAASSLKP